MSTVSTLLSNLGRMLNDPNENAFVQADKLVELNNAQRELVISILKFSKKYQGVYDLLTELVEEETVSVDTSGIDLNTDLSNRNILRNGFINSRITVSGEFVYPVRFTIDTIGKTQNTFLSGGDENPIAKIINNRYYIDVGVGSYPVSVTIWYVGEPYQLAVTASGSGKTQLVSVPDLNVILHDILVFIAKRNLLLSRGDQADIQEAGLLNQIVQNQILSLAIGQDKEPKSESDGIGQFFRKSKESLEVTKQE